MPHPDAATWRKLGVREGDHLVLLHAPTGWDASTSPAGSVARRRTRRAADVVVAFFASRAAFEREAGVLVELPTPDGAVWVAWPRKAAGHLSDLSEQVLRDVLLPRGVVDVKVARLDEDWSGLRFVWRRAARAARR